MTFQIRLAGCSIRLTCRYGLFRERCAAYEVEDDEPEFDIELRLEDVEREAVLNGESLPVAEARAPELESLAAYRKIAEALLTRDVLLMHGSVVAVNGSAVMFAAPSGTGKTTHTNLWLKDIPGAYVVNGDKPLLRIGREILACGSPWAGKEHMQSNCEVPLRAICFLRRAEKNVVTPMTPAEAFPLLMKQVYMPYSGELMARTMLLVKRLVGGVRFFDLQCNNFEENAAQTAWEALKPLLER